LSCGQPHALSSNLSSPKRSVYDLSTKTLVAELGRGGQLGLQYVVTHLGSHLGAGYESGLEQIRSACNHALSIVENDVRLLLENTARPERTVWATDLKRYSE